MFNNKVRRFFTKHKYSIIAFFILIMIICILSVFVAMLNDRVTELNNNLEHITDLYSCEKVKNHQELLELQSEKDEVIRILDLLKEEKYETYNTIWRGKGGSFKTWEPIQAFNKNSDSYKLLTKAVVNKDGLFILDDEYYCVAMATSFTSTIGSRFNITLESGEQFKVIVCDIKADYHTDASNTFSISTGCMTEFIVDYYKLNQTIKTSGTVSSMYFSGNIVKVEEILQY